MPQFKDPERGQLLILTIVMILIIGSVMMVGGFRLPENQATGTPIAGNFESDPNSSSNQNLQLKTLTFAPTPPATSACPEDSGLPKSPDCSCTEFLIHCQNQQCTHKLSLIPQIKIDTNDCGGDGNWCKTPLSQTGADGDYCIAKPVIYLYPERTTTVDVSVETPGEIAVSNPTYPQGGWKNVEAHPDGSIIYENKNYSELFYETNVVNFLKPQNGIVIPTSTLEINLRNILYRLGLNKNESGEFLDFWVPKLKNLNANFILFSVLDNRSKSAIDSVNIQPKPDTRIEFIAYFKPLSYPVEISPLILQNSPPERKGFVEVEWGGTIDNEVYSNNLP